MLLWGYLTGQEMSPSSSAALLSSMASQSALDFCFEAIPLSLHLLVDELRPPASAPQSSPRFDSFAALALVLEQMFAHL